MPDYPPISKSSSKHSDTGIFMAKLEKITDEISTLIKQASLYLKDPVGNIRGSENISTNVDRKISEFLTLSLKQIIDTSVLSEEAVSSFKGINDQAWLVDPIDGTLNFVAGSKDVAISVALVDKSFDAIISVVYFPFHNELYTAIRNRGAYLNGIKICHKKPKLNIIAYGLPGDVINRKDKVTSMLGTLIEGNYILRQSGSATIDICRVAKGTWKAFLEEGLYIWDVAAPNLISKESGCISFISLPGEDYKCNYVAGSTRSIAEDMMGIIGGKW